MQSAATLDLAQALDARLIDLWRVLGRSGPGGSGALSRTSASVLGMLRDGGPQRITALAAAEAVAQPSMTSLVIRLERDGLVARQPDPTDARAVLVAITGDGRDRLAALRAARADRIQERLRALDPDQRDALEAALPALSALVSPGVSTTS